MTTEAAPNYGYVTPAGGFTLEVWSQRTAVAGGTGNAHEALFAQRTQAPVTWADGEKGRTLWWGFVFGGSGGMWLIIDNEGGSSVLNWTDASPTGYQNDDQWHHYALVLDAATMKTFTVYLDGVVYTTQVASGDLNWNPGIMTLAGSLAPGTGVMGSNAYNQRMAYAAVFDKELSANKISEHYAAGSGGTVFYGDTENVRLDRIMDWSDVSPAYRQWDANDTVLQGIQLNNTNALDQAQNTAADAGGYLFADGQSIMRKHNRRHRYNRWAEMTLGEARDSTAAEVGMKFQTYEKYIYNDIRGTRPFGTRVRLENSASEDANGRKVYSIEIAVTEHEELQNAVLWIMARYGTDSVRVTDVKFQAHNSLLLKELAYARVEIGDMLVIESLPDPAPQNSMEFTIEGIDVDANFLDKTWTVGIGLSPNSLNKVFQVCAPLGLGDGDYVGY